MRIGLFGGAFDPVHLGHLILAERCREEANLDEVRFIPSYKPPHKEEQELTRFEHRCDMVGFALTGQPAFRVDPIEKELPTPNYTYALLEAVHAREPDHDYFLIVGADSLVDFPRWRRPERIAELAEIVVVDRVGSESWDGKRLAAEIGVSEVRLRRVDCPRIEIASRELRQRVQEKKSIRYLVPRPVEEFIRARKLYC